MRKDQPKKAKQSAGKPRKSRRSTSTAGRQRQAAMAGRTGLMADAVGVTAQTFRVYSDSQESLRS
jgi:hypothetical protein